MKSVRHIYYLFERDRKAARALYREAFGVSPDNPSIDDELEIILRDADKSNDIAVPAQLVLAMVLRPRGRGKGKQRPLKERWANRQEHLAVRVASSRWAELIADPHNVPSKEARHLAAKETLATGRYKYARLSVETLKNKMRLGRGKRDLED